MIPDLISLITSIGISGVSGFLIGYAIKKVAKIMLVVIIAFVVILTLLASQGIVIVDLEMIGISYQHIASAFHGAMSLIPGVNDQIIPTIISLSLPITGSLSAGIVVGFIKG